MAEGLPISSTNRASRRRSFCRDRSVALTALYVRPFDEGFGALLASHRGACQRDNDASFRARPVRAGSSGAPGRPATASHHAFP